VNHGLIEYEFTEAFPSEEERENAKRRK
jgi:hypothetical protein